MSGQRRRRRGAGGVPTLVYIDSFDATSGSLTSIDLGPAIAGKKLIATMGWNASANRTLSAFSIGGVAFTRRARSRGNTVADNTEIWDGLVSAATGDMTQTGLSGLYGWLIHLYYYYDFADGDFFNAGTAYTGTTVSTQSTTLNVPDKGIIVAASAFGNRTPTWTQGDLTADEMNNYHAAGSRKDVPGTTGLTVQYTLSSSVSGAKNLVTASYNP